MSDKPEETLDVGEEELDLGEEEEQKDKGNGEAKEETQETGGTEGKGKEKVRLQRLGIALKPSDEVEDSQVKKRKARQERFQAFGDEKTKKKAEREARFGKAEPVEEPKKGRRNSFRARKGNGGKQNNGGNRRHSAGNSPNNDRKRKAAQQPVDAETAEKRRKRTERFNK